MTAKVVPILVLSLLEKSSFWLNFDMVHLHLWHVTYSFEAKFMFGYVVCNIINS